jgi:Tfp pilus assembly protein PilX
MNKLPGVLLFLVLVIIILEILALRALSSAEKRIYALEKKVEALTIAPATAPAAAQPAVAK